MLSHYKSGPHRRGASRQFRLALVVLVCLALPVLVLLVVRKPEDERAQSAAEHFIIAMQSNDPDQAYAMGNEAFRSATTEDGLGQMLDQIEPFVAKARIDKVDSYYATSAKGEPRAVFVYTATKGSRVTYIRLVMEKQGDTWKVHSLISKAQPLLAQPE